MREGQRERRRERISSRLHTVSGEPKVGLELTKGEIMTWAQNKSWMLNRLSHPGAPEIALKVTSEARSSQLSNTATESAQEPSREK